MRVNVRQSHYAVCFYIALFCLRCANAHPMGNFSINHYAAIRIAQQDIELQYVIDMAEIPTFQEMQTGAIPPQPQDPSAKAYASNRALELVRGLSLKLGGAALPLRIVSVNVTFPPGAADLPTLRLRVLLRVAIPAETDCTTCELTYQDSNFDARAGWKEVIATSGPGVSITTSNVPAQDRSQELANYSADLLNSPPQDLEARIVFVRERGSAFIRHQKNTPLPGGSAHAIKQPHFASGALTRGVSASGAPARPAKDAGPKPPKTPRNAFTELMNQRQIGFGFTVLAALIAAALGGLHALEPGHGKTIVAAYLVGSRGTARHALLLGLIVTASHTAGVYLLGAITMYAQKYVLPERIYPFLAVLSGIFIAGMGFYLLLQRSVSGVFAHSHRHNHGAHGHSHAGFWHSHIHQGEHVHNELRPATKNNGVSARQLLLLGITGGMVPCPAALVVLLSAAALRRVGFGLFLIVCFSIGLALVLIIMGLLAIYAGRLMARVPAEGPLIQRWLPMASAATITVLGCVIAIKSLIVAGVFHLWL